MKIRLHVAGLLTQLLLVSYPVTAFSQKSSTISGIVTSEDGRPIAGARIVAYLSSSIFSQSAATSEANGSYQIAGLATGTYKLCAVVLSGDYLDPCVWSVTPPQVILAAGQTVPGTNLKLQSATLLKVRLDDPSQHLQSSLPNASKPHILIVVMSAEGNFVTVTATAKSASGADYQVSIPYDTPLKLSAVSKNLKVNHGSGASDWKISADILVPKGAAAKAPFNIKITEKATAP